LEAGFWRSAFDRALAEGSLTSSFETGDDRNLEVTLDPIHQEGKVVGIRVCTRDVTERTRTENLLRASETRFRTLVEKAPGPIGVSRDGIALYINDGFARMFGISDPGQVIGHPVRILWAPESAPAIQDRARRRARGEPVPNDYDGIAQRLDGTTFPVHVSVTIVELPDGPATVGFFTDITERALAAAALRKSEAEFRSYFELPLVGMATTSSDKRFLTVNDRICEILGYTRAELLKMTWADLSDPQGLEEEFDQYGELLAGAINTYSTEKRFIRKDGRVIWTRISVGCVRNLDGSMDHICGVMEDISEQKSVEKALRNAEREYRRIFEEAPEGIFQTSPEGKSIALNPAGARMLGFASSGEGVEAITDSAKVAWYDPEERAAYVREIEEKDEVHGAERRFKLRDGSPIWVSITARKVTDESGRTLYYQGFFENINERKRLESEAAAHVRELRILNEMNGALLHARAENELLMEYCRIMVEVAGYQMAWVGFAQSQPEKRVVPVAWKGREEGYLSLIKVMWDGGPFSHGPTGRAVCSGEIEVAQNFFTSPGLAPFYPEAKKRGFASSIAVPFRPSPDSMACLTAYGDKPNEWSESERRLMEEVASAVGYGVRTLRDSIAKEQYQRDLRISLEQTIQVIAETVDQRDPYTAGHQRRVADLCVRIASRLNLDSERIHGLRLAASIHDLGKVAVPAEILTKPGALSPTQYSLIQDHVQVGFDILRNVRFPWPISDMVHQHHERMDGSGYPQGLSGDAILLESRILAVADVVEAMATHRPYRPSKGIDEALGEVDRGSGVLYDADVVNACLSIFRDDGYSFPV